MKIVFSPKKRRPGCVLLQGAFGGDVPRAEFNKFFPSETWLVSPTDDMAAYTIDAVHSLEALSKIACAAVAKSRKVG